MPIYFTQFLLSNIQEGKTPAEQKDPAQAGSSHPI